jgi:hypothetical protein
VALPILSSTHFDQPNPQLAVHPWFMNRSDEVFRAGTDFALPASGKAVIRCESPETTTWNS